MFKLAIQSIGILLVLATFGQTASALDLRRTSGSFFSQPARANTPVPSSPVILSTVVDLDKNLLAISGQNFGKAAPAVSLAGQVLEVRSWSANQIVVSLPTNIQPATYLLKVTTRDGANTTSGPFSTAIFAANE